MRRLWYRVRIPMPATIIAKPQAMKTSAITPGHVGSNTAMPAPSSASAMPL